MVYTVSGRLCSSSFALASSELGFVGSVELSNYFNIWHPAVYFVLSILIIWRLQWIYIIRICMYTYEYICKGRFIMFFVITNIYEKKTKGPSIMELFTAAGKLIKCFLTTRDVRCEHNGWHGTQRNDIQVLATRASTWVHWYSSRCSDSCLTPCMYVYICMYIDILPRREHAVLTL
jgi:hypothetical protein